MGAPQGDSLGRIKPRCSISSMYSCWILSSSGLRLYIGVYGKGAAGSRSMWWSYERCGGNVFACFSLKTSAKSWYCSGKLIGMMSFGSSSFSLGLLLFLFSLGLRIFSLGIVLLFFFLLEGTAQARLRRRGGTWTGRIVSNRSAGCGAGATAYPARSRCHQCR